MLAGHGGGPRASGLGPVAFTANLGAVQAIIDGAEKAFSMHGEKVLRGMAVVKPTPATHAILTQLKAGERIRHSI